MHCSGAPPNLMSPVFQKLTRKNSLDKILSVFNVFKVLLKNEMNKV